MTVTSESDISPPIIARTESWRDAVAPTAHDCVTVIVVRAGIAELLSEFGKRQVTPGDIALLGGNTLYGVEPAGEVTLTILHLDTEYIIDQIYWQNVAAVGDRDFAQHYADTVYTDPAQIIRVGLARLDRLAPWLDELTTLTTSGARTERFYRIQALLFAVLDVIIPFVKTSPPPAVRDSGDVPARDRFRALRAEAVATRGLLDEHPESAWTLALLAQHVHLSEKQLARVFIDAYGTTPLAYLTMLRVRRMAGLLTHDECGIAEAGRRVGWTSRSHATEAFRRTLGVTPKQYRARTLAGMRTERERDRSDGHLDIDRGIRDSLVEKDAWIAS
ncbi:AraC family transcriptional regulator [Herbiconiux moechotypicola]|uniref:HTH araC/xylS-type domain-containing protein n=1 Tax=Herbiconiux moechotypicola TaxID=637393 RepID=A0ABP5Q9S0_9MICO|nr:AraC family transcriptional regulator [Herbiconiux moechotypicola]MCS5729419.1 AraC family transcriptional regulator [Herbiconiux moechotypicola]